MPSLVPLSIILNVAHCAGERHKGLLIVDYLFYVRSAHEGLGVGLGLVAYMWVLHKDKQTHGSADAESQAAGPLN